MKKKILLTLTFGYLVPCLSMEPDKQPASTSTATENTALLDKDKPVQCAICIGPFQESTEALPCGHVFCTTCLDECRTNGHTRCPLCRHVMNDWSAGVFVEPSRASNIPVIFSVAPAPVFAAPRVIPAAVIVAMAHGAIPAMPVAAVPARTCYYHCQQRCQQCYQWCVNDYAGYITCHDACIVPCCNCFCKFCPCGNQDGATYCCEFESHEFCCYCALCSLICAACIRSLCCCSGCNGKCPGYDQYCKPCIDTLCCTNESSSCCCCYTHNDDEGGLWYCGIDNSNCWLNRIRRNR